MTVKKYLVTTPARLAELSAAVNVLLGFDKPRRGVTVGGPDFVPQEYTGPGTPGWTDTVYRGSWVSKDLALAAVEVSPEMLGMAGKTVQVNGASVTFPEESEGVDELPAKLLPENGAFWWDGRPLDPA